MGIDTYYNNTNKRLHIGNRVQEVFMNSGLSVQQFAGMIPCKVGNIYKIYEREEISTSLLVKICKILQYDFFKLYSQELQLEPVDSMRIVCNVTIPMKDWKEGVICQYCEKYKNEIQSNNK